MPFLLSQTHSSLTNQGLWGLAGTRQMLQSSPIQPLLPRIRGWIQILQWRWSLYAHLLQANRNWTVNCILLVHCCIIWSALSQDRANFFCLFLLYTLGQVDNKHQPDPISRWIKSAVRQAYTSARNSQYITVYEVRALSTSWTVFNSASAEEILKAAYWNNETQ